MPTITCPCCAQTFEHEEPAPSLGDDWIRFRELWNQTAKQIAPPLISIATRSTALSKKLASSLNVRLKELGKDWSKIEQALLCIQTDTFFHGKNDRGWTATPEYLLKPGKIEELASRLNVKFQKRGNGHDAPQQSTRSISL